MNTHQFTQTQVIAAYKACDEMAAIISRFLLSNGGMSNCGGYTTMVGVTFGPPVKL